MNLFIPFTPFFGCRDRSCYGSWLHGCKNTKFWKSEVSINLVGSVFLSPPPNESLVISLNTSYDRVSVQKLLIHNPNSWIAFICDLYFFSSFVYAFEFFAYFDFHYWSNFSNRFYTFIFVYVHIGGRRMSERDLPARISNEQSNQATQLPMHAPLIHSSKSVPSLNSPGKYVIVIIYLVSLIVRITAMK